MYFPKMKGIYVGDTLSVENESSSQSLSYIVSQKSKQWQISREPNHTLLPVETFLRAAAEEDGWYGFLPAGGVAELHASPERGSPGQHDRRGVHPGRRVRHWARRPGWPIEFKSYSGMTQVHVFFVDLVMVN